MISEPGIYAITAEEYHSDPCPQPSLSSSIARILIQDSPRHARAAHPRLNPNWVEPDSQRHLDLGSLCHALMLEGEDKAHIITATKSEGSGKNKVDTGEPVTDYKTKAAQVERDEARARGLYPVLAHEMPEIHAMMRAAREQVLESEVPDAFTNGKPEQTLIWQEFNGVWCRARLDWLMSEKPVILDYKTGKASARPSDVCSRAAKAGWCMQASFYKRGFRAVFGRPAPPPYRLPQYVLSTGEEIVFDRDVDPRFIFVVQENFAPFALSLMEVSPSDEALADAQVESAIRIFGACLESGVWPGYARTVQRITSPPYYQASAEEDLRED